MRASDQVHAGEGAVQPTRANPVGHGASPYSGGAQLPEVHMALLKLGEARQLGVPPPPDELKPHN